MLTSSKLVDALAKLEGHPWAEYKRGKPISQNQLARALKPLGITPNVIRMGDETWRGSWRRRILSAHQGTTKRGRHVG